MGGRGSALWRGAILFAMAGTAAWLTGCVAGVSPSPEERTGRAEAALDDINGDPDSPDPGDTSDPSEPGDPGQPGDTHKDPEPQPWEPGAAGIRAGAPLDVHGQGAKDDDPEPQPWKPRASCDGQDPSSTTSSSKPH